MQMNMVSVIIPTYNSFDTIEETLNSVLNQTYKYLEVILVDDCSTDDTVIKLKEFEERDSRVNVISLSNNSGAAVARNYGLDEASGQYVAFLDADDIWVPNKLELQIDFMQTNNYSFTFTNYTRINENNVLINEVFVPSKLTYNDLLKNTVIGCSTVMIDKNVIGDFRMPLLKKGQDTATWLQILKKGTVARGYSKGSLTAYKVRKGSLSSNKISALKRTWYLYRHHEQINFIKSIYFFSYYVINAVYRRKSNNKKGNSLYE
ncbi:glycosyltransferase family 2 protein [Exiguobacterium mexicanum]|uniref:glycosyltransferase family 2 protein n=1 Tax=Exiguobacterium mexicanum TaxID=340146 RepID=UPI00110EED9F|nr:glycosyltransferase family 2 protein [Exiguobacterium mexicanum]